MHREELMSPDLLSEIVTAGFWCGDICINGPVCNDSDHPRVSASNFPGGLRELRIRVPTLLHPHQHIMNLVKRYPNRMLRSIPAETIHAT
jgi:hypothetical protein